MILRRAFLLLLAILAAASLTGPAAADPADIDAAARGVVRVVVIGRDGEEIFPISHGTGFAVGPETIVTNAHVVAEAVEDKRLSLGIVPSDGGSAVFGRLVAVSQRNDLALIQTTSPLRLPPLTIAGVPERDAGSVTSVGYPQNVDRAQGLEMEDLFRAQPPVKSVGYLSGRRPSRDFDTLLHTAPIARGSSGGPLLDECGRVIGVNSFGAESGGTDAEFFFAVSTRELLPFLRANDVSPRVNAVPCRSIADLEAADRQRAQQAREAAEARAAAEERALASRRDELRRQIEFEILSERENHIGLAFVLVVLGAMAAGAAALSHVQREVEDEIDDVAEGSELDPDIPPPPRFEPFTVIAGLLAIGALAAALATWVARPGFAQVDDRLEDAMHAEKAAPDQGPIAVADGPTRYMCTLDLARSRITGEAEPEITLDWSEDGCVNARTQYGLADGSWTRVFVPASEEAVSVNHFDPASGEFTVERYLLDREAMDQARALRADYEAPMCAATPAAEPAQAFGENQSALLATLPDRPNERLVYECSAAEPSAQPPVASPAATDEATREP